jgi:hypothetical protein
MSFRPNQVTRGTVCLLAIVWLMLAAADAQQAPKESANQLVQRVVQNELRALDTDHSRWMYLSRQEQSGKKQVKEVVQTKFGSLPRVVSVNDRPLTPEERQKDEERIQKLVNDPDEQAKRLRAQREDSEKARKMLRMFPAAFLYDYDGEDGHLIRLKFRPNPSFEPPDRETQVFHSMEGNMWIEPKEERLAKLSGHLTQDVTFGWGLLGRLEKGGTFLVEQSEIAPNHWETTTMDVNMRGHAIIFKSISVQEKEHLSDFHRVPDDLTLADAAKILQKETPVVSKADHPKQPTKTLSFKSVK